MKTITIMAVCATFGLAACGDNSSGGRNDEAPTGEAVETIAGAPSAPAQVIEAVRCWGLTHGAYIFRYAAPDRAGDLPTVSVEESTAWFNEALRRAFAAGLNQDQFKALQNEYQMSNRFVRAQLRTDSIEPIKACLAKTPTDTSEPPQLPEA